MHLNIQFRSLRFLAVIGLAAPLTLVSAADEEAIGLRVDDSSADAVIAASKDHVWLNKELKAADYQQDAANAARKLGDAKLDSAELGAITEAIKREPVRAGVAFAQCLNPKNCPDPIVRRGAVKGIEIANPKPEVVGRALAACVIVETNADVRKAAGDLIKSRKDAVASRALVAYYVNAFDDDGVLLKADHERAAIDAMKAAGGHAVYEQLLMYATMEVHAGTATEAGPPQVVYMTNGGNIGSPSGSINLPIELPNLELRGISTTLIVPALGALKQVTGQNFGHNMNRWRDWVAKQE